MLKFARKLTMQQYTDFFDGMGTIYDIRKPFDKERICFYFVDRFGIKQKCEVTDNHLFIQNYYKGSEDWKLYLFNLFGEEYLKEYGESPVENNFIRSLSHEDVKELLQLRDIRVNYLTEKNAFRNGTRSFIVQYGFQRHPFHEVVIGPHLSYCSGLMGVSEVLFVKFFINKFGRDFINYYINVDKENCKMLKKSLRVKYAKEIDKKYNYMISVLN